jgi:hypothetical protein
MGALKKKFHGYELILNMEKRKETDKNETHLSNGIGSSPFQNPSIFSFHGSDFISSV